MVTPSVPSAGSSGRLMMLSSILRCCASCWACFFCISFHFLASCSSLAAADDPNNKLKYAIAYCLNKAYPDTEFSKDSKHISGAYLQKGSYGLDTYESIREYVDEHTSKEYLSKRDRNLKIMQCIDLIDSQNSL